MLLNVSRRINNKKCNTKLNKIIGNYKNYYGMI